MQKTSYLLGGCVGTFQEPTPLTELFYGVAGWNCGMWLASGVPTGVFMALGNFSFGQFGFGMQFPWVVGVLGIVGSRVELCNQLKQFCVMAGQ